MGDPALAVIQAAQDAVYARLGVVCTWTSAGAAALAFTGLELGGDQSARVHSMVGEVNVSARQLKARVAELAALAPNVVPQGGDEIVTPAGAFLICGDPIRADPRRLEWTITLDDA